MGGGFADAGSIPATSTNPIFNRLIYKDVFIASLIRFPQPISLFDDGWRV